MGVSKNRGTPKWMVYFMENPIKMDDLGKKKLFSETPIYIYIQQFIIPSNIGSWFFHWNDCWTQDPRLPETLRTAIPNVDSADMRIKQPSPRNYRVFW